MTREDSDEDDPDVKSWPSDPPPKRLDKKDPMLLIPRFLRQDEEADQSSVRRRQLSLTFL